MASASAASAPPLLTPRHIDIGLSFDDSSASSSSASAAPVAAAASPAAAASSSAAAALPAYAPALTKAQCTYTSHYCEENVWKLCAALLKRLQPTAPEPSTAPLLPCESVYPQLNGEQVFAVFLSNAHQQLLLFKQQSGDKQEGLVCWDYHVLLVVKPAASSLAAICTCGRTPSSASAASSTAVVACPCAGYVYDLDSTLPFPCTMQQYAMEAFRAHLPPPTIARKKRMFRVIGARDFLATFASDRSHMLAPVQLLSQLSQQSAAEPTRREVDEEKATREREARSWDQSVVRDRLSKNEDDDALAEWNARAPAAAYLAPPPPYAPIRTAKSKMNLDLFRHFTFPDSGMGAVMTQSEFLDFFHVSPADLSAATVAAGSGKKLRKNASRGAGL